MHTKTFLSLISLLLIFQFNVGCKSTSENSKTETKPTQPPQKVSAQKSTPQPDETLKQVMLRIGQNYLIINLTILEHGIFSGVAQRGDAIYQDTIKAIEIAKFEKNEDKELYNMLEELGSIARQIQGCAKRDDLEAAKEYVIKWKRFSELFQ